MKTIQTIRFEDKEYPRFQSEGFASQFAFPYAQKVCKGKGVDIGCGKLEWCFPGAKPIDFTLGYEFHALNLPDMDYDYIFSSHLLEHLEKWVEAIEYWTDCLKTGGVLFLYLPDVVTDKGNPYHLPWNNRKHKSIIEPHNIKALLEHLGYKNIFLSGTDLNSSYMIFGEKGAITKF